MDILQYLIVLTRRCFFCQMQVVVLLVSFITAVGTPIEIASASISLTFLVTKVIVKMFSKAMGRKKINTEKLLHQKGIN